jgi:hypothetical protein
LSSSEAATPATRSLRSCPRRTTSISPSVRGRPRCHNAFSAGTCSGTWTSPV